MVYIQYFVIYSTWIAGDFPVGTYPDFYCPCKIFKFQNMACQRESLKIFFSLQIFSRFICSVASGLYYHFFMESKHTLIYPQTHRLQSFCVLLHAKNVDFGESFQIIYYKLAGRKGSCFLLTFLLTLTASRNKILKNKQGTVPTFNLRVKQKVIIFF